MPRNSTDNSLARYSKIAEITKVYERKNDKHFLKKRHISFIQKKKINKIDRVCEVLSEPYRTIIRNTFLEKKELYWWEDIYSKTTYYRLRNKAISTFLLAYNLL